MPLCTSQVEKPKNMLNEIPTAAKKKEKIKKNKNITLKSHKNVVITTAQ